VDLDGLIPTVLEAAYMAKDIYTATEKNSDDTASAMPGGWELSSIKTNVQGLKMGVYHRTKPGGGDDYALVNAGTDLKSWNGAVMDMTNNVQQLVGYSTDAWNSIDEAIDFVDSIRKRESCSDITMIGHSKGGAEATLNALMTNTQAITFNPMIATLFPHGLMGAKNKYDKNMMTHYVVEGDILNSTFGEPSIGKIKYLQSENISTLNIPRYDNIITNKLANLSGYGNIINFNTSIPIDYYSLADQGKNHAMDTVITALKKEGYK
jgi:hypothetical protein